MDAFERLRETFSLPDLEAERARLAAIVDEHARQLNRIDQLITLVRQVNMDDSAAGAPAVEPAPEPQDGRPSLDDAILRVMWDTGGDMPTRTLHRGEQILTLLEERGWAPTGATPRNTVDATLSRLVKQKRLARPQRGVYKLPSDPPDGLDVASGMPAAARLDEEGD